MATLLLAAAGAALGGGMGGTVAGLSTMVLGKAVGATVGSIIDQRLMGLGSETVEAGRVDRFRVMGSSEGAALPRVFGRVRVAGQLIWSSRFLERVNKENVGGKGGGGGATVKEYSYSVSLALALCEGEVLRVGRIWADGQVLDQTGLSFRLHRGDEAQLPDPLIAAIEGADAAPAYRGTAYVVIEDLELAPYGNRIPQFNFEVFRRAEPGPGVARAPALDVRGVALVPGTGEYSLATESVRFKRGKGNAVVLNVHNDRGLPDLVASLDQLEAELPASKAISLVVTWFGDDLRCGRCTLQPKVEQGDEDGEPIGWGVAGRVRSDATVVSRLDGRPVFGGTPADRTVIQAIQEMRGRGQAVMFYPFILMDILAGNGLADPWSGAADQPPVPWRGRITLDMAPGVTGSTDGSAAAAAEVAAFFGEAATGDFDVSGDAVVYAGPAEWSYRRFILHYAHLCVLAGGVESFCIGSEMRALTQIRDGAASYPAVREMKALAAEVRAVLGPDTKIGYAADWSEYFGHQPADGSGDVLFHLDPALGGSEHRFHRYRQLHAAVGLAGWATHADASAGSIYDLGYLGGNVAGGEGFDWYYADAAGRDAQVRLPISDGAYGEDWIYRYKDIAAWWSNPHVNRIGGVKVGGSTEWQPRSKPIWFTELGCPAVDKGTNQPNVFFDPKSSESFFPYFSSGRRDDFIQHRYLQATYGHWNDPAKNPMSEVYGGRMVDMDHAFVWAWDARPWPDFPVRLTTWVDGENYERGHWLNGRASLAALAEVVAEIGRRGGLGGIDVSALHGSVVGYTISAVETGRQSLQPLMLAHAFDSRAEGEKLAFHSRGGPVVAEIGVDDCALAGNDGVIRRSRAPLLDAPGRVGLEFARADADYAVGAVAAVSPEEAETHAAQSSLPIVMTEATARAVVERWLAEGRVARETVALALPPSRLAIAPGDVIVVTSGDHADLVRVDKIEEMGHRSIEGVRIEAGLYVVPAYREVLPRVPVIEAPVPVHAEFLDLPLMSGDEVPHAPHIAVAAQPWPGSVAVYLASEDFGYALNTEAGLPSVIGETLEPLPAGQAGLWMNASVRVRIGSGTLQSRSRDDVLNGANVAALRFGGVGSWEVVQFERAELVGTGEYLLGPMLRGQAGTDAVPPEVWPVGTDFVLLNGSPVQLDIPSSARGLARHFRFGPATRAYDDPSFGHHVEAFEGVGLRPYRPGHLAGLRMASGDVALSWVRRTRVDGDSWQGADVPLGEASELYHLRVLADGAMLREFFPREARAVYSAADQAEDGAAGPLIFEVAQVSDRFGPGPYERISFDG